MNIYSFSLLIIAFLIFPLILIYFLFRDNKLSKLNCLIISYLCFHSSLVLCQYFFWGRISTHLRWYYLFLSFVFPVILIFKINRKNPSHWFPKKNMYKIISFLFLIYLSIDFLFSMLEVNTMPSNSTKFVNLSSPLKGTGYIISGGGRDEDLNHHFNILSQKYAYDIIMVNKFGIKFRDFFSSGLEKYMIYDQNVYSPCDGEVIDMRGGHYDQIPPITDINNPPGNYIVIYCKNVSVILSHLKRGSIKTKYRSKVKTGEQIAKIGNSGNTTEPHLHIDSVEGKVISLKTRMSKGVSIPIKFGNRELKTNDFLNL